MSMLEYSEMMAGVLYLVYRRNRNFSSLHLALIEDLNNKTVTMCFMLFYHGIILLAPAKYCGFGLFMSFTGIIYIKIRAFNKFMQHHTALSEKYKKNEKAVQDEYNAQIDKKVEMVL
jgi:hypothetical protein